MAKKNGKQGIIRAKKVLQGVQPMLEDLADKAYVNMIRAADMRNSKRQQGKPYMVVKGPIPGGIEVLAYGKKGECAQRVMVHGNPESICQYVQQHYA